MKSILVPLERADFAESVVRTAWLLARAFGSYIEGFSLTPAPGPFLAPDSIGGTIVYDADAVQDVEAERESRAAFDMHTAALREPGDGITLGWLPDASRGDSFVGSHGRVFDITVVGRPVANLSGPRRSTLEAALFESGRPILIAPPVAPQTLGEVVTVAWNRSAETARTIAFALPLLRRARRTVIVTIEGGRVAGPSGDDLARYLHRQGIDADIFAIDIGTVKSTGIAILDKAAAEGSDLLVKGAFTQSRLSQMIFGGATRDILAEATLPVFMAH